MPNPFEFMFGLGEALSYIKRAVNAGNSFESLVDELSAKDIVIPVEQAQQAFNYLANVAKPDVAYIKNLQASAIPNLARVPLSLTKQLRNFSYTVNVTGTDVNTAEQRTQYVNISTNILLSKEQAAQMAADLVEGNSDAYGLDELTTTVEGVQQNMGGLTQP